MIFPVCNDHAVVQDSDPTSVKFEGALVNALIFVVFVGIMTFVLFLLFKGAIFLFLKYFHGSLLPGVELFITI